MKMSRLFLLFLCLSNSIFASKYDDDSDYGCCNSRYGKNHDIQFQLFDQCGFPVENTEFWVTIKLHKERNRVTLSLPAINFQTGQIAEADAFPAYYASFGVELPVGGTLRAVDGFLPEKYRPADPLYRSYVVPSMNGQSLSFTYTTPYADLPVPPAGYMLSINYSGQLIIQGVGTFSNLIAPGFQVMAPTDVTFYHEPHKPLCDNVVISSGSSNITAFTNYDSANAGYRDTTINDAYNNVIAYAWRDNSNIPQNQNTLNLMVSVGTVSNGKLTVGAPVQITDLPPTVAVWDTAITIDRLSTGTIIASYGLVDYFNGIEMPCRAVSFDGGNTWPAPYNYTIFTGEISDTTLIVTETCFGSVSVGDIIYTFWATAPDQVVEMYTTVTALGTGTGGLGTYYVDIAQNVSSVLINASPRDNGVVPICSPSSNGFGDNRGVGSDKYGNIWYGTTNRLDQYGNFINQPLFWASADGGLTFGLQPVFIMEPTVSGWDIPQFCFGNDEDGNYGLWAVADLYNGPEQISVFNSVGFVPINGFNEFGSGSNVFLYDLQNTIRGSNISASDDGRVWFHGYTNYTNAYIQKTLLFKSPGPLDSNYAGAWQLAVSNQYAIMEEFFDSPFQYSSYPYFGYFDSVQTILYDCDRQALYAIIAQNAPELSQNMTFYLIISRNNGESWSEPYYISSSNFANRGFQTMALDTATGNLLFGWYDGRNDKTEQSVQYYGAVLPSKKLDRLVDQIPLSNPVYETGPA